MLPGLVVAGHGQHHICPSLQFQLKQGMMILLGVVLALREQSQSIDSVLENHYLYQPMLEGSEVADLERKQGEITESLAGHGPPSADGGPFIGFSALARKAVHLPESSINKHCLVLGNSSQDRATIIKRILAHRLNQKARGQYPGPIVLIDPLGDLVKDTLKLVPPSVSSKVRLLDFGGRERIPCINLLDPLLFPDPYLCAKTIVRVLTRSWEPQHGRAEEVLLNSLMIAYDFNAHPDTQRREMLTLFDVPVFLREGVRSNIGSDIHTGIGDFQSRVLSRVNEPRQKEWHLRYLRLSPEERERDSGRVSDCIRSLADQERFSVIIGRQESTLMLSDLFSEGLVLMVSTARETLGTFAASLIGSVLISLIQATLRDRHTQASPDTSECLIACDEFFHFAGADWEGLLHSEGRAPGVGLVIGSRSLVEEDTTGGRVPNAVFGSVGTWLGYRMSEGDARIVAPDMGDAGVKEEFLANLDPHLCYARITSRCKMYLPLPVVSFPFTEQVPGASESLAAVREAYEAYTIPLEGGG